MGRCCGRGSEWARGGEKRESGARGGQGEWGKGGGGGNIENGAWHGLFEENMAVCFQGSQEESPIQTDKSKDITTRTN